MADALGTVLGMPLPLGPTALSLSSYSLNASGKELVWLFAPAGPVTVSRLGFRYAVRTGTPPTYRASLEGVTAAGIRDGTIKGGGTATATFTPPASAAWDNAWQWVNLGTPYAAARGEWLAVVVAYSAGTVNVSNFSSFAYLIQGDALEQIPIVYNFDGTTRQRLAYPSIHGYGSTTLAYGRPLQSVYAQSVTLNTTPDEVALRFVIPAGWASTFRVAGARAWVPSAGTGSTWRVQLYTGTTVLQSAAVDTDLTTGGAGFLDVPFDETTLSTLTCGQPYRLGVRPDTTVAQTFNGVSVAAAADLTAYPQGQEWYLSTRTDDGAWADTTTTRPFFALILDDLTAGGGGVSRGRVVNVGGT